MVIDISQGRGIKGYTPEMGQKKPRCQLEAELAHDGRHYFVWSKYELKGVGIGKTMMSDEERRTRPGIKRYYVTARAMSLLKQRYSIASELNLD